MENTKHTNGPWRVSGSHPWRVEALVPGFEDLGETATICEVGYKPNARLLAAAPELLEALELIVKRCGPKSQDGAIARAAIAKAKGETQ